VRSSNRGAVLVPWALMLLGVLLIAWSRPGVSSRYGSVKRGNDPLLLPPPEQVLIGSLGYRAAVADALFAHVLVWYGEHLRQKVRFEFVAQYLDIVTTLDPTFREPYYYGDALITLQTQAPERKDYEAARRLLERGVQNRPYDTELWLVTGQFLAYSAPPYLKDEAAAAEWRLEGARKLARACELVNKNENIPYHCITAAGLFDRAGDRASLLRFLERVVAAIDDPAIQELALAYWAKVRSEEDKERLGRRRAAIDERWKGDLPIVNRVKAMVIGPSFDPAACAGLDKGCVTSWRDWAEKLPPEDGPLSP
jgi:hypothetical protein